MTAFKSLLDAALVGTDRQAPSAAVLEGPVGQLLQQIAASPLDPPQQLLQMAGVLAVCGQAGFRPAASPATVLLERAATDNLPQAPATIVETVLRPVLADGPERLQHEAFRRLEAARLRLPPRLLPAAMELGRRSVAIRAPLTAVAGERGRWLAMQNPAWRFATGASATASPDQQWELGSPEQRRAVFERWRVQDAAAARERLGAGFSQLPARERAEFLPLMAAQLSETDEPFIDALLKDRSKEVRQSAAELLLRLPQSRHARALCAALSPLVRKESGFLGSRLVVEAPAAADAAWKDEAIDATRPTHESLGERAWWLYQLVRQAPLAWWAAHTGMQPEDLLKASGKSEWKEALQRGWRDAAIAAADIEWAEALLSNGNSNTTGYDVAPVLACLPLERRERHWLRHLAADGSKGLSQLLATMLAACPAGWTLSADLSARLAKEIASVLRAPNANNDYSLRYHLPDALCLLHTDSLGVLSPMPRPPDETASSSDFTLRLDRIASARRALAQLTLSNI